jgi:hypothetical protein
MVHQNRVMWRLNKNGLVSNDQAVETVPWSIPFYDASYGDVADFQYVRVIPPTDRIAPRCH